MGSIFGHLFRVSTWGESHGEGVGVVVDGCPSCVDLTETDIQPDLDRRRPGQSSISTQRQEGDRVQILSGVFEGQTLGSPISIIVWNQDAKSKDYEHLKSVYRPSHADYTTQKKYGIRNYKGGGRASARETIGRVAAGAIAKKILREHFGVRVLAYVKRVAAIDSLVDHDILSAEAIEKTMVRCPDPEAAQVMIQAIKDARKEGDSLGGVVECLLDGVPAGWGEPVFDKMDADLAKAMLSIPACKAFEVGSGFLGTHMKGSEHNDLFYNQEGVIRTRTNHSGGIQGGITNGEKIVFRAGFKPTATLMRDQKSVNQQGEEVVLAGRGRHDPCVLPRAVPIVEAMAALVLVDHALQHQAWQITQPK
jgi:chorismate synthase